MNQLDDIRVEAMLSMIKAQCDSLADYIEQRLPEEDENLATRLKLYHEMVGDLRDNDFSSAWSVWIQIRLL